MATIRAVPTQRAKSWVGDGDGDELGREFCSGTHILADDGFVDAELDIFDLCGDLRSGLGGYLENLPRDKGVEFGGDIRVTG